MLNKLKNTDTFTKNIVIVFAGTSLANFFNLLYQLLIAHRLPASEFAAFNSLLSILMLIGAPIGTIQIAMAKYSAEFYASGSIARLRALFSDLFRKTSLLAGSTLFIFLFASFYIMRLLKITSAASGYILAILLALSWLLPFFMGAVQGLELFRWLAVSVVVSGALKLSLAFILISLGYGITGALWALLISVLAGLFVFYLPLKKFIAFESVKHEADSPDYPEMFGFLFPVAISYLCFFALVGLDMVLVKYYFTQEESGFYALAQMVGKIFLFLPAAVSIVMFPRTSGLNAKKMDTHSTLKKSLLYALGLCILASFFYNSFPVFVLKVLTGKSPAQSVALGRLFSISMSFFAGTFVLISYFLSIKDLRFIKYLALSTLGQLSAIIWFHNSLMQVQLILCINSVILFFIHLALVYPTSQKGEQEACKI